jgi:hypothetical protein
VCLPVIATATYSAGGARAWAATLHVPAQFSTPSEALAQASAGDTVRVAPGRYLGTLQVPDGVAMIAGAGPDSTVLDGDGDGPVVLFEECDLGTLLDGFTITGGLRRGAREHGAGILCRQHAAPRINHNRVVGNRALGRAAGGGGIALIDGSDAVLSNNEILDNEAARGGGIWVGKEHGWTSSPVISGNRILANRARLAGGGLSITHGSEPLVTGNVIARNVVTGTVGEGAEGGGGLHIARGQAIIQENTIWANADSAGIASAICLVDYAAPSIDRNIVAGHRGAPAILCVEQLIERQVLRCNDVWNPEGIDFAPGCRVYPTNIAADPNFCDAVAGDFGLRPSSPCLGHEACGRIGAEGIGCGEPAAADPQRHMPR